MHVHTHTLWPLRASCRDWISSSHCFCSSASSSCLLSSQIVATPCQCSTWARHSASWACRLASENDKQVTVLSPHNVVLRTFASVGIAPHKYGKQWGDVTKGNLRYQQYDVAVSSKFLRSMFMSSLLGVHTVGWWSCLRVANPLNIQVCQSCNSVYVYFDKHFHKQGLGHEGHHLFASMTGHITNCLHCLVHWEYVILLLALYLGLGSVGPQRAPLTGIQIDLFGIWEG